MRCAAGKPQHRSRWSSKALRRTAPEPPTKQVVAMGEKPIDSSSENDEQAQGITQKGESTAQVAISRRSECNKELISDLEETLKEKEALIADRTQEMNKAKSREAALLSEFTAERKLHHCERRHYEETIKSLRRQRDQAEKEAATEKGVSLSLQTIIGDLQCQISEKDKEINILSGVADERTQQSCELQADIEELKWKLGNERNRSKTLRKSIQESSLGARRGREEDREEIQRLLSQMEARDAQLEEKNGEIQKMQDSLRNSVDQNGSLIDEVVRLKDEITNLRSSGSCHEECEQKLEEERRRVRELRDEMDEKKDEKARLQKDFEDICESMKALSVARREEVDELQAKISQLTAEAAIEEKEMKLLKLYFKESELKKKNKRDSGAEDSNGSVAEINEQTPAVEVALPEGYEQRIENLKTENDTLRSMFTSLWDEATELRSKVTKLSNGEGEDTPQTIQELKQRNKSLEKYVAKLEKAIRRVLV